MIKNCTRPAVLITLLAVGFLGCATSTPKKEAKADEGEYEWFTPTGSNIAVKVPKGYTARTVASPADTISGEALSKEIRAKGATKASD